MVLLPWVCENENKIFPKEESDDLSFVTYPNRYVLPTNYKPPNEEEYNNFATATPRNSYQTSNLFQNHKKTADLCSITGRLPRYVRDEQNHTKSSTTC